MNESMLLGYLSIGVRWIDPGLLCIHTCRQAGGGVSHGYLLFVYFPLLYFMSISGIGWWMVRLRALEICSRVE